MNAMLEETALDRIYQAIVLDGLVQPALQTMETLLGASAGAVIAVPLDPGAAPRDGNPGRGLAFSNLDLDSVRRWGEERMQDDPLIPVALRLPPARVFTLAEQLDVDAFERSAFYNEVFRISDMFDTLSVRAAVAGEAVSMTLYRPRRWERFQREEIRRAQALQSHLSRAFRLAGRRPDPTRLERVCETFGLTLAEAHAVGLIMSGQGYPEIAATQRVSRNTLKWRMREIFAKFRVRSRAALIARCASL